MPYIAINRDTGERIDITKLDDPRAELTPGTLICQLEDCRQEMVVVAGLIKRHHFRHKSECPTEYNYHPESPEHLDGKACVAEQMDEWFSEFTGAHAEFEVPVKEVSRIADVMFTFPNGWQWACEVQLASITTQSLSDRTKDYLRAGVDTLWMLGGAANTTANRQWLQDNNGYYCELESHGPAQLDRDNVVRAIHQSS